MMKKTSSRISFRRFSSGRFAVERFKRMSGKRPYVKTFMLLLLFYTAFSSRAANLDSLQGVLKSSAHDSLKLKAYYGICWHHINEAEYTRALIVVRQYMSAATEADSRRHVGNAFYTEGVIHARLADSEKAVTALLEGLRIREEIGDVSGKAYCLFMLGFVHYNNKNYTESRKYNEDALALFKQANDRRGMANCYTNLSGIELGEGNFRKALELAQQANAIFREVNVYTGVSTTYCMIGGAYRDLSYDLRKTDSIAADSVLDKAIASYLEVMRFERANDFSHSTSDAQSSVAVCFAEKGDFKNAILYADSALFIARRIYSLYDQRSALKTKAKICEMTGDLSCALRYTRDYHRLNDSLDNAESSSRLAALQSGYETEQKEALQRKDQEKAKVTLMAFAGGSFLLVILALVLYRGYRRNKRNNALLAGQNALISQKNDDITASIRYSSRIQGALLPGAEGLAALWRESFVLYKPKDIVSGDFYWVSERAGKKFLLVADCTGHGVPGALMSVMSVTLLNEAVNSKGIEDPAQVLEEARQGIIRALRKQEEGITQKDGVPSVTDVKDGMDCALIVHDPGTGTIEFAGAYNPLWLIRAGRLSEIEADRQPVGISEALRPFTRRSLSVEKGDLLYLFTDGYADQFGGPKGKKFKYRQLQELLLRISDKPAAEQKNILDDTLENWRGKLEQVDDILVIGLRIT